MQASELLNYIKQQGYQSSFFGDMTSEVNGFCSLQCLKDHSITWIKQSSNLTPEIALNLRNRQNLFIVTGDKELVEDNQNYLVVENPKAVFFNILSYFFKKERETLISEDAVIKTDQIGKNVSIGHHCYIDSNVVIGDGTVIGNHVSIDSPCVIGKNVIIYSGVVIGTDGFGYFKENNKNRKVPHFGGVSIGNDVEIGANTCIDRGTIEDTVICDNVKIDNLCHIGHNVYIGENSLVTALTVLGGSCKVEKNSYIGIGSVVKNHIEIGENALVGMGAVVTKSVLDNKVVAGVPAKTLYDNNNKGKI